MSGILLRYSINVRVTIFSRINSSRYLHHAAVPTTLVAKKEISVRSSIDDETIQHLERLSLVNFANVSGVKRLEAAIDLADIVRQVNTEGVEPLYSILEDESLFLREDVAREPDNRAQLMKLATKSEEDYYSAPQGNIPLNQQTKYHQ